MNRFGCSVVSPFEWQPTRNGLRGLEGLGASEVQSAGKGAATGASIGSSIPLVGTAVGAILGAVGGAIAGALNKSDPETANFDQAVALWQVNPNNVYNIANKYLPLAGLFDLHLNNPHIPIYLQYGRMGEQRFVNDLVNQVYSAAQQGRITANDTPLTIMANVVQPWIDSWGKGPMVDPHADLIQRLIVGMIADYVTGQYTNWHAVGGDFPFGNLPKFSLPQAAAAAAPAPASSVNPVGSPAAPAPAAAPTTAPAGVTLQHGTNASMGTPYGIFSSQMDGTFKFLAPGTSSAVDIAYGPEHTGGVGTAQIQWTGNQVAAFNTDGSVYSFNPTTKQFVQVSGPTAAPVSSPAPAVPVAVPAVLPPPPTVAPVGTPAPAPVVPATIPQVATPTPSATVATTSGGQTVTQADLQAMIAQLAAQGQTAQQAYQSALQALQNNGVQATPQVQSAVQSAVQATPAPATAGVSSSSAPGWAIAAGVVAIIFATARPETSRRRRSAKR